MDPSKVMEAQMVLSSNRDDATPGAGVGDGSASTGLSSGGGALRSEPRLSSSHLSMSSARPTKGRLPRS